MSRIAYVNGAYVPLRDAAVHIEDRGYQFADGIYEVALFVGGRFWDLDGHLARWDRSLRALEIPAPMSERALRAVLAALTALGYSVVEAQAALQSIPKDAPDNVEEKLRLALGYFQ